MDKKKREPGFTLIELMIVIAIIAVLAAIAIPNFMRFQMKARQSEARILLSGLYGAEVAFFAEASRFSSDYMEIHFSPIEDPKYYKNWYLNISADTFHFTATCSADIDNDTINDVWVVTERNRGPWNLYDDVINEPNPYPY
jgi:type IV pilus assembly protein PilA